MSDSSVENKVVVHIFGEEYPITGVLDSSHISRVAEFVDRRMKDVSEASRSKSRDRVAILVAMSMASELLELRDNADRTQSDSNSQVDDIIARLDRAMSG